MIRKLVLTSSKSSEALELLNNFAQANCIFEMISTQIKYSNSIQTY